MPEWKNEIRKRLADLALAPLSEAEIAEEWAQHLEDRYHDLKAGGATDEESRRAALAELSDRELLARELRQVERPARKEPVILGARRRSLIGDLRQDLRYGLRLLLRNPGFAVIAVITLALGTGANTAVFSLINTVMLRPLPVEKPEQLVALNNTAEHRAFPTFSYPNYQDFRDRNAVLSGLIAYRFAPLSLSHDGVNERLWGYLVSGNYFELLGVEAALGRVIAPDDDRTPGGHPVAVVSYRCWQRRFGGRQDIIGRNVVVNGRSYALIGVAPPGFYGTEIVAAPEMWFPMAMQADIDVGRSWLEERGTENLFVQGRLKPGVSLAQAQTALDSIALQLEREFPQINEGKRVTLSPAGAIGSFMRGPVLGFSGLLMVAVALVLLLACANLSNLLLARVHQRGQEIAVRLALGARRFRLVRQLLTESLLLALGGGVLGLLFAFWLVNRAEALKPPLNFPLSLELYVDHRVFVFTCLISLLTAVLFGLLPAAQATRTDLVPRLKEETSLPGLRGSRLKDSLIVLQVALSLVLLIGGGLMLRALRQAATIELGFNPLNAVEVSFDLRLQGYDEARGREFQKRLLERLRVLPPVKYAGIADVVPIDLHFSRRPVFIEGQPQRRIEHASLALYNRISPGYFQAMSTGLMQGRDFNEHDDENSPAVAIINETFARRFWPGEDPIGKRFTLGSRESRKMEVIGVAQDGKYGGLSEEPKPFVYRPLIQSYTGATNVIVRGEVEPQQLLAAVRDQVQELDPHLPITGETLVERMRLPLLPARLAAGVLGGFGLLALGLAAMGIYGVISCAVSTRTREIGIRMALGARKGDVLGLVIGQGMTLTLIGVAAGLLAAWASMRLLKSFLFGVSATDPWTYAGLAALLAGVALAACYLPARRATKVDPMVALRYE